MMVIFLVGLVSMILMRTLRKDYARYSKDEEMDDMVFDKVKLKTLPEIIVFFYLLHRNETWETNTVGSRCMVMSFVRRPMLPSFQHLLAVVITSL